MFLISQVRCADMPAARQTNHSVVFGVNKSKIDKHLPKRKKCDTLKVDEVLCVQHFSFQTLVQHLLAAHLMSGVRQAFTPQSVHRWLKMGE